MSSSYFTIANIKMLENGVSEPILETGTTESPLKIKRRNKMPTPGGPLTEERIKDLGVIKMNDYLISGTRPQFWEEYFVKIITSITLSMQIWDLE